MEADGIISLNINYWDLRTGKKSDHEFNHQTSKKFKDSDMKDITIDIDDKITSFSLAGDLDQVIQKIFVLEFTTKKGLHFRHGLAESDVPKTCILNVDVKPDEYVLGFFGNL